MQSFEPTLENFYSIGQIFFCANGQIIRNNFSPSGHTVYNSLQHFWSQYLQRSPPPSEDGCNGCSKSLAKLNSNFCSKCDDDTLNAFCFCYFLLHHSYAMVLSVNFLILRAYPILKRIFHRKFMQCSFLIGWKSLNQSLITLIRVLLTSVTKETVLLA